ncbi:MAG: glycoside hydrolase family 31 protein [Oscillospiraceae bacterium]|jgi:alpha-D-xyloside xylohydrolase|nr:glycoside hydrolase family 31 protein [Oscillospiraceae bacterium]
MFFLKKGQALLGKQQNEILKIEAWGENALRVRSTKNADFSGNDWALSGTSPRNSDISVSGGTASIRNGKISAHVNTAGVITFYKENKMILREYYRSYGGTESRESSCLKVIAREFKPIIGADSYQLNVRFEGNDGEKIYGMGQYQHAYLNQKGCVLELAQRNSQVSIPFAVSNLGYGFLWNNPAVGKVMFGKNYTEWHAEASDQIDYWITADDSPAAIVKNYTQVTGRAPMMPENVLGLWQCKLRYRTQEEVLQVARKYKKLGIPLDVIVIDFFHWTRQGDWCFDPEYWPDPKAMVDELHSMGVRVMVSVWPSVDRKSKNFQEMFDRGLLIRTERGTIQTYDFNGDCVSFDAMNPEARDFVWGKCRENYYKYGIDMFWLDNAEPDYAQYDFDNYRYYLGPAVKVSNIYPLLYTKTFYDGLRAEGQTGIVSLVRSAWAGSQKYAALVWSGDVRSTFESFRDQLMAGLNMGLAGIPWWTTDIGGFMGGDVHDPAFVQLLIRWFQFAVFTPVLRMHGDRDPHDIPPLSDKDYGGGYLYTGQPNEMWSYGEKAFQIMKKYLKIRLSLKPYLLDLMKEAHQTGAPLMRTMFYEFPGDEKCWDISDQYMFGSKYLVAPVLFEDQVSRKVYLPSGCWENVNDGKEYEGGQTIECSAPIDCIPVFLRK